MSRLYLGICRYKHLFTKKKNIEKIGHEFEREQRGVAG